MYAAIDIGATKTLLAVFDADGKLLESVKITTNNWYPTFVEDVAHAYKNLKNADHTTLCVVGAPGKVDRSKGNVIAFGNLPWENVHLRKDFSAFVKAPVIIENDSNLAGLSEAILIRHGYKHVLYLTVSTGIGAVIVKDGVIDKDHQDMEVGQMIFEHNGHLTPWEDFASGHAIKETYGKLAGEIDDHQTWYAISRNLAIGINHLLTIVNPDVIVFGGGVGAHFEKFADQLHEELMLFGSTLTTVPPLRKALRAEEAVIYGCYEFARQQ